MPGSLLQDRHGTPLEVVPGGQVVLKETRQGRALSTLAQPSGSQLVP